MATRQDEDGWPAVLEFHRGEALAARAKVNTLADSGNRFDLGYYLGVAQANELAPHVPRRQEAARGQPPVPRLWLAEVLRLHDDDRQPG